MQPACVIGSDGTATHAPLPVGSFVHIGSNVSIAALGIGSHVVIGDGAVIENAVDVKSCVVITSGSVVKEATICPSHTGTASAPSAPIFQKQRHHFAVWHGVPASCVATLHPSFEILVDQEMKWAFEAAVHTADFSSTNTLA